VPKTKDLLSRGWLEALVIAELERHDPAAALASLPADVRGAGSPDDLAPAAKLLVARSLRRRRVDGAALPEAETFLEDVRLHVGLILDLAVLRGGHFDPWRRRAEIAAMLAAAAGEWALAVDAHPGGALDGRAVSRAMRVAEEALREHLFPPGDPVRGLPLYPGHVAVQRRLLSRVALGHHRVGRLDPVALERHAAYAAIESALLAETLAGLLSAVEPVDPKALAIRQDQLEWLGLPRAALKAARRAIAAPRRPDEIARAAPERVRPFLAEQVFLAVMTARLGGDPAAAWVESFVAATGLEAPALAAAKIEAAAQDGVHRVWFDALGGKASSWKAFAREWESATDQIVERVGAAVTDNVDAIVTEVRQTGELGTLLAKAAAGGTLSAEERRKVREQLIDLAKAVPALAIFAAPGGMLLLPLLAKLLPFDILPSAWDRDRPRPPRDGGTEPRARPDAKKKKTG
jgi:hypothetical protein